jgi:hypothetical protein
MIKDEATTVWISTINAKESDNVEDVVEENGERVFTYIRYSLVCEACAAKRTVEMDQICPHNKHNRPSHQSARKMKQLAALMKSRPEDFARETLNINIGDKGHQFESALLDRVFRPDNVVPIGEDYTPEVLLVIDPAGGQKNKTVKGKSDYVIMSMIPRGPLPELIITGFDAIQVTHPEDYLGNVARHIKKLKSFKATQAS